MHSHMRIVSALTVCLSGLAMLSVSAWGDESAFLQSTNVPQTKPVIAFGDSITQGYELPPGAGWVELLAELAKKQTDAAPRVVLNAGAGGNTSSEGLKRWQTDVLAHKPAVVLVEFGGNDAVLGPRAVSVDDFRRNLLTIAESVRNNGGEVIFLTFPPVINEWHVVGKDPGYDKWGGLDQCVEQYRQQTRDVANTLGARLFDLDEFVRKLIKQNGKERYILKDGVHLTVEANALLAEAMLKFIEPDNWPLPSAAEPLMPQLSLPKAAASLDRTAVTWIHERNCGSCHTGWPYLMSRAVLRDAPSPAINEVRAFFENRITNWDADDKIEKHEPREIVGTATALAMYDAQSTGTLQAVTRQALDRMWTLQRADGAWDWTKCGWPPYEIDDYYGAVLAAVGVGQAPESYSRGDSAKVGVEKLCVYFKNTAPPSLHHKTWLLWASVKLDGLLSTEEQQAAIKELVALQRSDGGWSMESLGKDWVGQRGEKANPDAPSDGYGTGLVVFVLRQAGVPTSNDSIQRGKAWLTANQRVSGRWFTRSLNGVKEHFISDTATAFAILALDACQ